MSEDWPSAPQPEQREPLPRIEDLPVVWEGYDRAWVQAAFDGFYRHIAQLDATLRTLEAVDTFREQAGELRADLRSIRAAGWSPYPRGYSVPARGPGFGGVPDAVPRIALEVAFLIVVAVVVAVASFSPLEIVAVILIALALTFLIEFMAARDRRAPLPLPPAAPAPPPVAAVATRPAAPAAPLASPPVADDGAGWAAFAEPSGGESLTIMGALGIEEERVEVEREAPAVVPQPEPEPDGEDTADEPPPEPIDEAIGDTLAIRREQKQTLLRRRRRHDPAKASPVAEAKHVRVLPAAAKDETDGADDEYPPWERGFDFDDEE